MTSSTPMRVRGSTSPEHEDGPYDVVFTNAKTLLDNGIRFSIQSADAHNARNLPYHAAPRLASPGRRRSRP